MIPDRGFVRIFSLVSIVLILLTPGYGFALCESNVEGAGSALEAAEEAVASAYLSVSRDGNVFSLHGLESLGLEVDNAT